MARTKSIGIRDRLTRLLPAWWLEQLAKDTKAVQRKRKVDIVALFWSIILGFGTGRERNIAGLRRSYEAVTGQRLVPSAFYGRFTKGLCRFIREILSHLMQVACEAARPLRGVWASFKDVVLTDATVVRLHDLLVGAFPACRTNHTLAASKLHVIMSVADRGPRSVKLTAERVSDGAVLRIGRWVRDRLLLFDLGYYRFQLFSRIAANGGYFISRIKTNANPKIVSANRVWRGRSVPIEGQRLKEILPLLRRGVLDAQVVVEFYRRKYQGRRRRDRMDLRLVAVRDERSGGYHTFVTNIPADRLDAAEVGRTYAARWEIELLFKQLGVFQPCRCLLRCKSHYRLGEMPSRKREVVEALLYAALVTLVVSNTLLALVRQKHRNDARRARQARWAALFAALAREILLVVVLPPRKSHAVRIQIEHLLVHEALDPNVSRASLCEGVQNGSHRYITQTQAPGGS
jgi:IS4 transposase